MIVTLLDIILLISLELTVVSKSDLESENLGYIHPACSDRNVYFKNIDSGRRIIGGSDACIKDYPFAENADLDLLAVNLKEVDVPIIGTVTCQHYYESDTVVETNICAGYDIGEKDACGGDSGGPLICNGILMGLVSWGYRCAFPESPGVYTRVKSYLQWINKTVMGKHSSWHYLIPASSGQISGHLCVSSTCANKTHSESTPAT
ncbi:hypothetical protein C0J52_15912 [Blattella germanica]|nr:hypothetical protein C0J52_15912 [Blattella germanica]